MNSPIQVSQNQSTRLFVGGVIEPVSTASLTWYFSKFGEVESCEIMAHPATGVYKGFGFVTFKRPEDARRALDSNDAHVVDGIRIEINSSFSRKESQIREQQQASRKVFLDNLPNSVDKYQLAQFLSMFGEVQEVNVMQKSKKHGFGFAVFRDEKVAKNLIGQRLILAGGSVTVQLALSKIEIQDRKQKIKNASNSTKALLGKAQKTSKAIMSDPSTKPSSLVINNNLLDKMKSEKKDWTFQEDRSSYGVHEQFDDESRDLRNQIEPRYQCQRDSLMMPYQPQYQQPLNEWTLLTQNWNTMLSLRKTQCMCIKHRPSSLISSHEEGVNLQLQVCSQLGRNQIVSDPYVTQNTDLVNMRRSYQQKLHEKNHLLPMDQNNICFDQYRYVFRINPSAPNLRKSGHVSNSKNRVIPKV